MKDIRNIAIRNFRRLLILMVLLNSLNACEENSQTKSVETNISEDNLTTDVSSEWKCSICKKTVTGSGYEEVSEGVWEQCKEPYQCQICSRECGMKHTGNWNNLLNNTTSSSSRCTNCNQGSYVDGFCNTCGGASSEKTRKSVSEMPDCGLCNGTGIERPTARSLSDDDGRICPMCEGTGKKTY